jgi:hypothetical protein
MKNEIINTFLYKGPEGAITGQFLIDEKNETL